MFSFFSLYIAFCVFLSKGFFYLRELYNYITSDLFQRHKAQVVDICTLIELSKPSAKMVYI